MPVTSAALCVWRLDDAGELEVFIVHPGGPFWAKKDGGAWSLPKGEFDPASEDGAQAARREFEEEVGQPAPDAALVSLGETRLKSGKIVYAWAVPGDIDADKVVSNTFEIEWPPRSGRRQAFPEVDRAMWGSASVAVEKLNPAQAVFVERLLNVVERLI